MEAMKIKNNADPYKWVQKLMNITGKTFIRDNLTVKNVVITAVTSHGGGKIVGCEFKDEDGLSYHFTRIDDYEIVREITKPEYNERAKRTHRKKISDIQFNIDKQMRSIYFNGTIYLSKDDIAELRRTKKKNLGSICEYIDVKKRWVYYKNCIVKERI